MVNQDDTQAAPAGHGGGHHAGRAGTDYRNVEYARAHAAQSSLRQST
jgi:hypothetical protein